ncbi:MAG: RNA polymerase ECF-type sigma factor, partial [uncultured Blastococcus sp.]
GPASGRRAVGCLLAADGDPGSRAPALAPAPVRPAADPLPAGRRRRGRRRRGRGLGVRGLGGRPGAGPGRRGRLGPGGPGTGGRRRGLRPALRPLRDDGAPLRLLPGGRPGDGRGRHERDLRARPAPDRLAVLPGPRRRCLAGHHRPQHHPRPREEQPVPARGRHRRHAGRRPGHRRARGRGPRPPHQPRAAGLRPAAGQRAAGVHRAALRPGPLGVGDRADHGQEGRRHQGAAAPRRPPAG